ncbi:MAG TPA: alpha/beta hydrolase, partial [Thermodesulfobacteriota bacterium]|nr:alpha/beta hydrolase [Thermodesulfobacteriota bacterium]
ISLLFPFQGMAWEQSLLYKDTRPGVKVPLFFMRVPEAKSTVVLLTGGTGDIGLKDGIPTTTNFLIRSRDLFAANGFNVAVIDLPSDKNSFAFSFGSTSKRVEDLRIINRFLKEDTGLPVWLVGTSRGTILAAAAAAAFVNEELAGIVLTSSLTSMKKGGETILSQNLGAIRIPVLILHHERDACQNCPPAEATLIFKGLKNAPIRKLVYVNGGKNPSGDPCQPDHWHGFVGMEKEAVGLISYWIMNPTN